jgi:hypothetical protein
MIGRPFIYDFYDFLGVILFIMAMLCWLCSKNINACCQGDFGFLSPARTAPIFKA